MVTRAAVYCRISRDREGTELGTGRQEADCRQLADQLGAEVVEVLIDNDQSASTRSRKPRPKYTELLSGARAGRWNLIIAYSSSRLTRRPLELEAQIQLAEQHGVRYAYLRSPSFDLNSADGRATARTLAAWDAAEAERAAERISREKQEAAAQGRWRGGRRPYGYQADGVTVEPAEAAQIAQAGRQVLAGASLRSLAAELNEAGYTTSTGKQWHAVELRRVLLRARNAGLVEQPDGSLTTAEWEPIVPRAEWEAIRRVLTDPTRKINKTNHAKVFLGVGLYLCGVCDDGTTVRSAISSAARAGIAYYTCSRSKHLTRHTKYTDELVEAAVLGWIKRPEVAPALFAHPELDTQALDDRARELRNLLDELADMVGAGELTRAQHTRNTAKVRAELAEVEEQLIRAASGHPAAELVTATDIDTAWAGLDISRKQAVVDSIAMVTLLPSRRGRPAGWRTGERYFDPETVRIVWK